ncbi:MAG TPA: AI-2E family transporter [Bryobacteraceae bacterium]|nr:AI-2E family transporter [Bryobacteraceae bacterium]
MADTLEKKDETLVERPNIDALERIFTSKLGVRSFALTGLLALALFYTLYLARDFFLPIAVALVLSFLLQPLVRGLHRLHIPEFMGAGIVLIVALALLAAMFYELSGPVTEWAGRVPEVSAKLRRQMQTFRKPVDRVTQMTEQVQSIAAPAAAGQRPPQQVEMKRADPLAGLFSKTYDVLLAFFETMILLYFLLSSGDMFLRKLIHVLPRFEDKRRAVQIAREVEDSISHYLLTVAVINAGLGTAGGLAFWALGMPNPALWGVLGFVLNFVPYLGALTLIGILTLVATATFPTLLHALMVPACYLALGIIEGNFITPWIVGRRMTLNPVVIFLGLVFWGWMWGIPGALLAVPMIVIFKIFCDHVEPLAPVGEFLGG